MPAMYLERDINSYRYLMRGNNYDCIRMYGYGQGMMTQTALLLDQFEDARQFIERLLNLPKFDRFISPEGIILHESREFYVAVNNYMGQDAHLADSVKAVRLMLGFDDNSPHHFRLVPRYLKSYTRASVKDFPVILNGRCGSISTIYG